MASLKLDVGQWKALVLHDMAILGQALHNAQMMDPKGLAWVDSRWDVLRNQLMVGWENYSRPALQQAARSEQESPAQQPQAAPANGPPEPAPVEPPKKKRADAGKPRGPRKAKDAMPAVSM